MHDNFFNLENPETCYLMGYFWADAAFSQTQFGFEILDDDFVKLWPMLENIGFSSYKSRIRKNSTRAQSRCRTSEKDVMIRLEELGFRNRFNECPIYYVIKDNLKPFFIKGFLDGDGTVSLDKNNLFRTCFYGGKYQSWTFLEDFCKFHGIEYTIYNKDRKKSHHSHTRDHGYSVFEFVKMKDKLGFCSLISKYKVGLTRKMEVYEKYVSSRIAQGKKVPDICRS